MIIRLTEKIWIVEGGKGGQFPYSHSLYIRDGGGFLVDAGSDSDEIERLRRKWGLSTIVMTHCHEDHFTFLSTLSGAEVWAAKEEAPAFGSLDTFLSSICVLGTEWEPFLRKLFLTKFRYRPTAVTRTVSDGEELLFGETRAVAVIAPGHAAGHLCLHFPDDGILFLGDYDLSDFGPFYADKSGGIKAFRCSARRLAEIGAERNVVSHGEAVHRGSITGKMEAYLDIIARREEALREFLREPRSRSEIIARRLIYGPGHEGAWFDCGEWTLLSRHLEAMIDEGDVTLRNGVYTLTWT